MPIEIQSDTRDIITRSLMRARISRMIEERRYEEAGDLLQSYYDEFGADDFYYVQSIDQLLGLRAFNTARDLFNEAVHSGMELELLKSQAFRLMVFDRKYEEALRLVEKIGIENQEEAADDPNGEFEDYSSLIIRGSLCALLGDYGRAAGLLEDSLLENYDQAGQVILSFCYILMGQKERGFEIYHEAISQDSDLKKLLDSLLPAIPGFQAGDDSQVEEHAERLLENFARFAFDVYEQSDSPDMFEHAREMISEDPEEFLEVLRFYENSSGPSPYLYLLESICHELLGDETARRSASRKILTFAPSSDRNENETRLPLQLAALSSLSYKKPTVEKHLRRLYEENARSLSALRMLCQSAYSYGLISLGNSFIVSSNPEDFENADKMEVLYLQAVILQENEEYGLALALLSNYKESMPLHLARLYVELAAGLDEYDEVMEMAKKWLPDPRIAFYALYMLGRFGDLADYVRLNTYMISDKVKSQVGDSEDYALYEACNSPSGVFYMDYLDRARMGGEVPVLAPEDLTLFLDTFFSQASYGLSEGPGDTEDSLFFSRPFTGRDSREVWLPVNPYPLAFREQDLTECSGKLSTGLTRINDQDYLILNSEKECGDVFGLHGETMLPDPYFPDSDFGDDDDLSGFDGLQPLSEFRKYIRNHPEAGLPEEFLDGLGEQFEDQISRMFERLAPGSVEDRQIFEDIDGLFETLHLPDTLLDCLPVVLTDPRFVEQCLEAPGFEDLSEDELERIMGTILMYLGQEGIEFPSGYEDLEEIIFSDYYLSLYDAAAEVLRLIMLHIHKIYMKAAPESGNKASGQPAGTSESEISQSPKEEETNRKQDLSEDSGKPDDSRNERGQADEGREGNEDREDEEEDPEADSFYISTDGLLN